MTRGQVFILHLAIGKQKGAGGISNAESGVRKDGGSELGIEDCRLGNYYYCALSPFIIAGRIVSRNSAGFTITHG